MLNLRVVADSRQFNSSRLRRADPMGRQRLDDPSSGLYAHRQQPQHRARDRGLAAALDAAGSTAGHRSDRRHWGPADTGPRRHHPDALQGRLRRRGRLPGVVVRRGRAAGRGLRADLGRGPTQRLQRVGHLGDQGDVGRGQRRWDPDPRPRCSVAAPAAVPGGPHPRRRPPATPRHQRPASTSAAASSSTPRWSPPAPPGSRRAQCGSFDYFSAFLACISALPCAAPHAPHAP